MIYRHNDIFIENSTISRTVSNYIYDLSIRCNLKCDAVPVVYLDALSISPNSVSFKLSISCGAQRQSTTVQRTNLVAGSCFTLSTDTCSIIGVTPVAGEVTISQPLRVEPYKVELIISDEAGRTIELNHGSALGVTVSDNIIKLNLNDPDPIEPDSTDDTVLFMNGVSANPAGNIDISATGDLRILVEPYKPKGEEK